MSLIHLQHSIFVLCQHGSRAAPDSVAAEQWLSGGGGDDAGDVVLKGVFGTTTFTDATYIQKRNTAFHIIKYFKATKVWWSDVSPASDLIYFCWF